MPQLLARIKRFHYSDGPKLLHPVFFFVPLPYPKGSLGRDHDMWPTSFQVIVPVLCAFQCASTLVDTLRTVCHLAAVAIMQSGPLRFKESLCHCLNRTAGSRRQHLII